MQSICDFVKTSNFHIEFSLKQIASRKQAMTSIMLGALFTTGVVAHAGIFAGLLFGTGWFLVHKIAMKYFEGKAPVSTIYDFFQPLQTTNSVSCPFETKSASKQLEATKPSETAMASLENPPSLNLNTNTKLPVYEAYIALRTDGGGYVGKYKKRLLHLELNGWTLENGVEIPSNPKELLLNFLIYNQSGNFREVCSVETPLLPASLFEGKKEGEWIDFEYHGQLLRLFIQQKGVRGSKSPFESHFACVKKTVLEKIDVGFYGFNGCAFGKTPKLFAGYTLKHQGVLYFYSKEACKVTRAESQKLKKINRPNTHKNLGWSGCNTLIRFPVCGISEGVDIVINEKFLCVYAKNPSDQDLEFLHIVPWKKYFKISQSEMEQRLFSSKINLEAGLLTIDFNSPN